MAVDTFTASGTWTAPAGIQNPITVECYGPGGAGEDGTMLNGGRGGGGGAYASKSTTINELQGYAVTIDTDKADFNAGEVVAVDGDDGSAGGVGGQAAACTGTTKFTGGSGGQVNGAGGGGGGEGASAAGNGNNGTDSDAFGNGGAGGTGTDGADGGPGGDSNLDGTIGVAYSGGGGGGGTNSNGGATQTGAVVITYTVITPAPDLDGWVQPIQQPVLQRAEVVSYR